MTINWIGTPGEHQRRGTSKAISQDALALFWEPGAGKTYAVVHAAKTRFRRGEIDMLLVLCPKAVRQVWPAEFAKWGADVPYDARTYDAGTEIKRPSDRTALEVLVAGIESLSQGRSFERIQNYVKGRRVMIVMDESSRIKNPSSKRTKNATTISWLCKYRMILTGTPVLQGPHDLFAQLRFLDPDIIGIKRWVMFRNRYCVIGGFENRQIIGYQNLDELTEKIAPNVDLVRLVDCVDIPAKIYQRITVPLSKEQKDAIRSLKDTGELDVPSLGVSLAVEMALERMTRIQQIVGGSYPQWDELAERYTTVPLAGEIPKMDAFMEYLEDLPEGTKCLVWARFHPERDRLEEALVGKYGREAVVRFDGSTSDSDRKIAEDRLQSDPTCRFFLGNQAVAGLGLTLTAAKYSLLYSNTFSAEDRIQVENRNHRTGQKDHCIYVDFEAMVKEDRMILAALTSKKNVAEMVKDSIIEKGGA